MISSESQGFFKTQQRYIPYYGYIFVNKIPLLITISRKIDFAATSHFLTKIARNLFKSFWCIYVFYLKRGFKIMTVHADREFAPVRELIA